jgi:hypothetical protein
VFEQATPNKICRKGFTLMRSSDRGTSKKGAGVFDERRLSAKGFLLLRFLVALHRKDDSVPATFREIVELLRQPEQDVRRLVRHLEDRSLVRLSGAGVAVHPRLFGCEGWKVWQRLYPNTPQPSLHNGDAGLRPGRWRSHQQSGRSLAMGHAAAPPGAGVEDATQRRAKGVTA